MIKHIAWDHGVIEQAFAMVLPMVSVRTATTTTLCGKRVNTNAISNEDPTCLLCQHEQLEQTLALDAEGI